MKLVNQILESSLDTTIANIAKKSGNPLSIVKKKFIDIEKALVKNKVSKESLYPIAVSTLKKAFDVK